MKEINKIFKDLAFKRKKLMKDVEDILSTYSVLESDLRGRFNEEFKNNKNKLEGLEDFYSLNTTVKKNFMLYKNLYGMVSKIRDITDYNISEEDM